MAIRPQRNGGGEYIKFSRPPILTTVWQAPTNSTPVLSEPIRAEVIRVMDAFPKDYKEMLSRGVIGPVPISNRLMFPTDLGLPTDAVKVIDAKDPVSGGTIKAAVNQSGEVVATKKDTNFVPLAIAGAIALMIFGG